MNTLILRGCSGAGKSSFCDLINDPKVVCCADDFYMDDQGNYNWDANLIPQAHAACRAKFDQFVNDDAVENIIIANTNTKPSDWKYYEEKSLEAGRRVIFVVLEHRHDGVNVHRVPQEALKRQEKTLRENLKFL
jgi:ABC-type polar amino acid transport system ATPase subunit